MPDNRIAQYLAAKRANIERISVQDAYAAAQQNDGTTLIDTRPSSFRASEGAIPGAIVIERNVLEWRLDPTSPDCITEALATNFRPVILCNDSYASSLAVDSLQQIGVDKAVDLEGGFRQWKRAGLPVEYTS